jgi:hypothetical protein|tara:strand:+ start:74 stop:364 length:291 start_codon:yes stop_codon:yes gene_type:complete
MAITKGTEIGRVEVVGIYKQLQVRTDTVIKEDGVELSRKYHRHVLSPGNLDADNNFVDMDISGEAAETQGIANAVWTQAIKDAWKAKLIADRNALG